MLFHVAFSHLLSLSRHFLANNTCFARWWEKCMRSSTSSPAVPVPVTWCGTSNCRLVAWKCFAFHPHVILVKLARQSGNLWFDCVYVVLRHISQTQFLAVVVCSKKSFWRMLVLEKKTLAFVFQISLHAILQEMCTDRTAFLALLCTGKNCCYGLSAVPSLNFPAPFPESKP